VAIPLRLTSDGRVEVDAHLISARHRARGLRCVRHRHGIPEDDLGCPRCRDPWIPHGGVHALHRTDDVRTTTIQLSKEMKGALEGMKLHPRETYEDVLERLLEDLRELNEETKKEIERARREIKAGKHRTHDQLKAELGF